MLVLLWLNLEEFLQKHVDFYDKAIEIHVELGIGVENQLEI